MLFSVIFTLIGVSYMGTVTGTFTGTGQSAMVPVWGKGNLLLDFSGASATVVLERSFDKGSNWYIVSKDSDGSDASYTDDINATFEEPEPQVYYRWNCTGYSSGTVTYRISSPIDRN